MGHSSRQFLTTREVAELLRVKERKVYDLAAAGEIPHRRMTGKLLFPAGEIEAWIEGSGAAPTGERPAVVTGSHDPLLEWAIRQSECGLATLFNGSGDGLGTFGQAGAAAAGLHVREGEEWNLPLLQRAGLQGCVLVGWAVRARGLILADRLRDQVKSLADLCGKRMVMRQPGAGAQALFEQWLAEDGLQKSDFELSIELARTEVDAAAAVAGGEADAAVGIEAMARSFHLAFLPRLEERFDLLVDRRSYFTPPFQTLLDHARSPSFQTKAMAMGGYVVDELGKVRWISP
ncbi:MAG: helix-turn-helix transcriptional regulator [Geminicoccaceae bacterium]